MQGLPTMDTANEPFTWELDVAQARWSLDQLRVEKLPDLATRGLIEGLDTPSMRELAGIMQPDYWTVVPLFERMMGELRRPKLDRVRALKTVVLDRLRRLVAGSAEPGPVAIDVGRIWLFELDASNEWDELSVFYQLGEEWEERSAPWTRPPNEIEAAIKVEAQRVSDAYQRDLSG